MIECKIIDVEFKKEERKEPILPYGAEKQKSNVVTSTSQITRALDTKRASHKIQQFTEHNETEMVSSPLESSAIENQTYNLSEFTKTP